MCHLGPPGNSCKDRIISIRDLVGVGGVVNVWEMLRAEEAELGRRVSDCNADLSKAWPCRKGPRNKGCPLEEYHVGQEWPGTRITHYVWSLDWGYLEERGLARKLGQVLDAMKEDSQSAILFTTAQQILNRRSIWCNSVAVHAMKENSKRD